VKNNNSKFEMLLDKIEDNRLLDMASARVSTDTGAADFDDVIEEFGFTHEEIFDYIDDVEIE
jgi:hypothetical protein